MGGLYTHGHFDHVGGHMPGDGAYDNGSAGRILEWLQTTPDHHRNVKEPTDNDLYSQVAQMESRPGAYEVTGYQ